MNRFLLRIWILVLVTVFAGFGCASGGSPSQQADQPLSAQEDRRAGDTMTIAEPSGLQDEAEKDLELWVMTDPHYLSASLFENDAAFSALLDKGDGKMTDREEVFLDAFLDMVVQARPDALLIPGDLTFNGEKQSLLDFTEKLLPVQEAGVPVLVIPGNHDVDYPYASRYLDGTTVPIENISQADFLAVCASFGYNQSIEKDPDSFSYLYPVSDTVSVLMLDCNTQEGKGRLLETTLQWADSVLEKTEGNTTVLSVSHQNLLPHNPIFIQGFVMENAQEAAALLKDHGVEQHISGHSHLQNTATADGLTDTAVGSFAVGPLRYVKLHVPAQGPIAAELCAMDAYNAPGIERFQQSNRKQVQETLASLEVSEDEARMMEEFAIRANQTYFFGTMDQNALRQDPAWQLWKEKGKGTFLHLYFSSFIES